ncbi:hypothetical protein SAMN02745781_00358 [Vibrio gazogenes DSM 21264]|uniref:Uncharacterized protein n=1 Tax=Vibrio gazogenes DSM 21264 = NBRC 103151 TaxID=1123492 RepID=A0A1M4TN83_VIBGA|nr:hypothetical protein SAMN02745781_00358 [Vibrio gazogenes DSM 21264] [Vibrio gazogenes DSM 21264 = NBRC 103151]SJN52983.1 hypothetical protein BQ6471_00184 [Vibrio gazogenes]
MVVYSVAKDMIDWMFVTRLLLSCLFFVRTVCQENGITYGVDEAYAIRRSGFFC